MQFSEFSREIVKIKNLDLPGEAYHLKMAPIERLLELKRQARDKKSAKQAAVLCLFYPNGDRTTHFTLILRNTYKGVHSAQIGFPGGKVEAEDTSLTDTALREFEEEVGVNRNHIKVLKQLTEIYIPPSNFFVQPFLGMVDYHPQFVRQEEEVDAILEVPLSEFLDDSNLITQKLTTSYAKEIEVPAFQLQGQVVWGATAMMLNEIREMLRRLL